MTFQNHAAAAVVAFLCISAPALAASKPSFDCGKARTDVEKAICADPALATQDASIAAHYGQARKAFDEPTAKALADDQRYFVHLRNDAYAEPFNQNSPRAELSERLKYRDLFLASIALTPREGFEGYWGNLAGGFSVKKQADGQLFFEGQAAHPQNGRWVCDVSGIARVKDGTLVIDATDNEGWTLTLKRIGAGVELAEAAQAKDQAGFGPPYCGLNGHLSGVYFPVRKP
ncbi:hypothetical protein RAS12_29635 [Achromobacter seleniivolatilans]|uniref:Lysozyme inhibitor LprI-like N-terminal domain-containing protein n=1 Tax=Achromobacter seleniivolatilans TaxID=3047478 RepID=A0ABY9M295_9BURK|nr:lysozyme inhibitor LprI family protein [Achromobacter sp. R39]WMD20704.1 hypothetical protein RAS12_29635 [Achromobacter sp. R39]